MQIKKEELLQILYTYKNLGSATHITLADENVQFLEKNEPNIHNTINNDNDIIQNNEQAYSTELNDINNKLSDSDAKNNIQYFNCDNKSSQEISKNDIMEIDKTLSKQEQWEILRKNVLSSPELLSHVRPGKQLVFGVGNLDAKIFFCGEAPGADEEIQGEPFVGRAGQLLTKMIAAMGLSRQDVYIGNIMNWRPETGTESGNRPPTQEEMEFCLPFLIKQIEIVKPKAIVALGATAVNGLLGIDRTRKMSQIRGSWRSFCNIPLMITFHPSYILRNNTNAMKRLIWEDLLRVMEKVGMQISDKQRNYFL